VGSRRCPEEEKGIREEEVTVMSVILEGATRIWFSKVCRVKLGITLHDFPFRVTHQSLQAHSLPLWCSGGEWSALRSGCFIRWIGGWMGHQSQSGRGGKEKISNPFRESNVAHLSRSLVTIPTELPLLSIVAIRR
jgi:hypothetical protein